MGVNARTDYTDHFREYWERAFNSRTRSRIRSVAQEYPIQNGIPVEVTALVGDEIGVDFEDLRTHPDQLIEEAREGFEEFVADADIDETYKGNFENLRIHFAALSRWTALTAQFQPDRLSSQRNTLSYVQDVPLKEKSETGQRLTAAVYECPVDHQTRIQQPLYDRREITICGEEGCSNSVYLVPEDSAFEEVSSFTLSVTEDFDLPCVGAGKIPSWLDRIDEGQNVLATGILRFQPTENRTGWSPCYEILYIESS